MTHPGGRPTAYGDHVIPTLEDYIASCGREQTELPTLEGLAERLDVCVDTITDWQVVHPEFLRACKRLMEKQRNQLINDGLYGGKEVNPTMAIFLLKANHDFIETERKMLVGKDGEKLEGLVVVKSGSPS